MKISIIVPIYNSSKFVDKLLSAIETERIKNCWNLELILIDDGSKDNSYEKIVEKSHHFPYIIAIKLARNFGHQYAVKTGLSFCSGDYIAIIDDDLQDPPSLLPGFFKYLDDGFDVAFGVRKKRKESLAKRVAYNVFYRVLKRMSEIEIPLDTGDFCVMKKVVVVSMLKLQEKNPFLRGIRAWVGFKQIGIEYSRSPRIEGESGYTIKKLLKIAIDGIFSFSNMPIRIISILGMIGIIFSILYSFSLLYMKIFDKIEIQGFTSMALLVVFFGSLTIICLGIIGEYIVRIYDETRNRPDSVIAAFHRSDTN